MTFAPKLDCSQKTKGMKDGREIFLKPKGTEAHVKRRQDGVKFDKESRETMGVYYDMR